MSLRDGNKKMSKSGSDYSRINLRDTADEINKIKKTKSDSEQIPDEAKLLQKPEALNLLTIYSELTDNSLEKTLSEMAGKEYSYLKTKLTEALIQEITQSEKKLKNYLKTSRILKIF